MSDKHPGGRPPIWTDPKELQKLVDNYFDNNEKVTLAGLAVDLGVDRQTLYNYEEKDEFFGIIKEARDKVLRVYEERLIYSNLPTGVIFALKNMGWKDRQDFTTGDKPFQHGDLTDEQLDAYIAAKAGKIGINPVNNGEGKTV
jgi:hypothetical protein